MIIETIVTTIDSAGQCNIAPMGAILGEDRDFSAEIARDTFTLKPFASSQTWQNLMVNQEGVLHLTDNAHWFVCGALNKWDDLPATQSSSQVNVPQITDACRSLEFVVDQWNESQGRGEAHCRVVHVTDRRPFGGVNRSLFAAIEMAILATRFHLASPEDVDAQWQHCRNIFEKTAGNVERRALAVLEEYRADWCAKRDAALPKSAKKSSAPAEC
jgi:hypothetical protein